MDRSTTLDLIFAHLRSGVLALDHGRAVLLLNPTGSAILAVDPERAQGRPYTEAFAAHPPLVEFLADALRINAVLDRAEVQLQSPRRTTLGLTATPLPPATGGGLVVLFKDLTQVERMEEQAQLRERLMALGQMAAGLAHEMRNPLASIKVTAGLLRKTLAADPDVDRKLRSIMGDVPAPQSERLGLFVVRPSHPDRAEARADRRRDQQGPQPNHLAGTHPSV